MTNNPTQLTGLSQADLISFVADLGEHAYRGRQIFGALHQRRLRSLDEITELPKDLRAKLNEGATAATLALESRYLSEDGTRRYLMKTRALNDAYGVGVKVPRGINLVGMGAGEPFLAFESLMKALRIMADPKGLHIVPRRVTVSTAGVVPRIRELATIPDRPHLAISLAAATDELRERLMPINKKWPLEELLAACKEFEKSLRPGERFTFEYVMLEGVNDSDQQARQLANLLNRHGLCAKVNLIPQNPAEPLPYRPSLPERIESFKAILESKGVHAFVRRPRGRDIFAACGQLAARSGANSAQRTLHQMA